MSEAKTSIILPCHEVTHLFPGMTREEYLELVADIKRYGLREPIWTYQGMIIDGRHRAQACREAGVEPRSQEWNGVGTLIDFVVSQNLIRRHLTTSQRAMIAVRIERQLARGAQQRRLANLKQGTQRADVRFSEHRASGRSAVEAAKRMNISKDTVLEAKKMVTLAPELEEEVCSGMLTLSEAKRVARLSGQQRTEVLNRVKSDQARTVKGALLELHKAAIEAQAQAEPTKPHIYQAAWEQWLPDQPLCDLLLTDPPYSTDVEDIVAFARAWLPSALSKVKDTGKAYIFIGAYPRELHAYLSLPVPSHLQRHNILVWEYKNTLGPQPRQAYKQNWQAILYFAGVNAPPLDCPVMTEQLTVHTLPAPDGRQGNRYHAWQKPDELAERLIRHSTKPGDLVLDCFAGTGTFLLAAHRLGRVALGCDSSEDMLKQAEKRGCIIDKGKDIMGVNQQCQDLSPGPSQSRHSVFECSHPAFLAGMQLGAKLFQQEHGQNTHLTDLALMEFYQNYLTPFDFDPPGNAGVLVGGMRAFLASGLQLDFSAENAELSTGYHIAAQDWHIWRKDELLKDAEFAKLLAIELAPDTLATMRATESWYTETYQIGYVFGLVHGLLTSPDIQIVEYPASQ